MSDPEDELLRIRDRSENMDEDNMDEETIWMKKMLCWTCHPLPTHQSLALVRKLLKLLGVAYLEGSSKQQPTSNHWHWPTTTTLRKQTLQRSTISTSSISIPSSYPYPPLPHLTYVPPPPPFHGHEDGQYVPRHRERTRSRRNTPYNRTRPLLDTPAPTVVLNLKHVQQLFNRICWTEHGPLLFTLFILLKCRLSAWPPTPDAQPELHGENRLDILKLSDEYRSVKLVLCTDLPCAPTYHVLQLY